MPHQRSKKAEALAAQIESYVGDAGTWAVENAIQLHGGIGFTWEIGLHLALRRTQRARLVGVALHGTAPEVVALSRALRAPLLGDVVDWSERT